MNKELILKYKTEFDHWLNGGKLRHKAYGKWEQTNNIWSCRTADIAAVVIDDQYVEFRKALADGKIIQLDEAAKFSDPNRGWVDLSCKSFGSSTHLFPVNYYRIKPEET